MGSSLTSSERSTPARRRLVEPRLVAIAAGLILVVYGNAASAFAQMADIAWTPSIYPFLNGAVAIALIVTGQAGAPLLGRRLGALGQTMLGTGAGLGLAAIPVTSFLVAPLAGGPVQWEPAQIATVEAVLWRSLVVAPLGVALFEEVLFRGWLDRLIRHAWPGAVVSAVIGLGWFIAWHLVVTWVSVGQTQYGHALWLQALAYVVGLAAVAVGGVVFLALRRWSGGLLAPVLAHWVVNVVMTGVLTASAIAAA